MYAHNFFYLGAVTVLKGRPNGGKHMLQLNYHLE